MTEAYTIKPIGWVISPFKEKFGVPRQAREIPSAIGTLHFHPEYRNENAIKEIHQFSHLWLVFKFHLSPPEKWQPLIRPPRLGGNSKVGVFASRSPFRPNQLGISSVQNIGSYHDKTHGISLRIKGLDIVHNTPIFDIKPYLPHHDSIPEASTGYSPPTILASPIIWKCNYQGSQKNLIEETIALNPAPGYKISGTEFGCTLGDENIIWKLQDNTAFILEVKKLLE